MEKEFKKNEIAYYIDGIKEAYVSFEINALTLTVIKTYVSDRIRGQGIARLLMNDVINYAAQNKYNVRATCGYALKYLENK